MIKDETRDALRQLVSVVEEWRLWTNYTPREDQSIYEIYDEAEKFVKAFRRYELKIDD